tara:strand:- start:190 stop:462 length:273 start_codon:yes stop_codon:yes gene_type:complete
MKNKPKFLEAEFLSWVSVELTDYDDYDKIDWNEVSHITMKYTGLVIVMRDGTEYDFGTHEDIQTDNKYPTNIKLFDGNWNRIKLNEEEDE